MRRIAASVRQQPAWVVVSSAILWFTLLVCSPLLVRGSAVPAEASAAGWTNAPWSDPGFFPLAVWLQSPANAQRYKAAGINTYVGLWRGPTPEQLTALESSGMRLVCGQNRFALSNRMSPTIIAWMHGDEPDNAQSLGEGKGWGPPVLPEKIVQGYQRMRETDPSRPILLNLGQGVAWDGWHGRGVRSNHPEDYPKYIEGCDIASFDIYPAVHDHPDVSGKLWFVAAGVERLVKWSDGRKVVWNCLECTRISNPQRKPTPREVRAEAWMSIIHGSRGLIYFVHQFKPTFREAALLDDPEMLAAVTTLNRQITRLAPVLNSPSSRGLAKADSGKEGFPIATMAKKHEGSAYVFAVAMRDAAATGRITFEGMKGTVNVEVLDEGRTITSHDGIFEDKFEPWDAHIYRIRMP